MCNFQVRGLEKQFSCRVFLLLILIGSLLVSVDRLVAFSVAWMYIVIVAFNLPSDSRLVLTMRWFAGVCCPAFRDELCDEASGLRYVANRSRVLWLGSTHSWLLFVCFALVLRGRAQQRTLLWLVASTICLDALVSPAYLIC